MVSLSLSFLGPFQAFLDGKTLTGFDTQKTRALLAYLAVENTRPHNRETLAGLLWPESPQAAALSSLRNALANLRKVTRDQQAWPPFFLISRDSLQLNPENDAWIDVGEFEKLSALNRLESAIDLYQGEFLEGFSLTGSPEFEAWILVKRQTYQRLALELLHTLAVQSAHIGQTHQALTYTRRILVLEPWDEAAHQQVMLLLALTGQRTAALAQYKSCQEILNNELGVEPNQETTHLYEQIRTGEIAGLPSQASTLAGLIFPGQGSRLSMGPLFADRQAELERLSAALRRVLAGKGQVVFISGSPGSGKTFLVQAFIRQALASHPTLRAATGRCQAYFGQGDPYLPFREALEMLTGRVQEGYESGMTGQEAALRLWRSSGLTIQTLVEEGPALVGTFLPGAALLERACKAAETRLSGFPSGQGADKPAWLVRLEAIVGYRQGAHSSEGLQQAALFSQFTNLMCSLARQAPLVLFLDDMQWADLGSLSMLFSLGRGISNASILIVGAYRGEEIQSRPDGTRHPLAAILNEFRLLFPDPVIDMDNAEERPFIDALLDEQPNRLETVFRERLHHLTRGHPLYTVELLRGMQERGDLVQNREGEWVEGSEIHWDILPGRVEAAISERIERLPPDLHACLQIASVEGEGFTVEVISEVQGCEQQGLRKALSDALGRRYQLVRAEGITRVNGQRLTRYRFRHILFQRYLYSQLDPVMRLDLHEQVGQALQRLYAGQPGEVAGQLAHHFERAGLLEKAVHYLGLAGERAADQAANQEAVAYFTHALELVPEADLEIRFGLLLKRWEIFSQTGQTGREVEDVQGLEKLAEKLGTAYRSQAAVCRLYQGFDVLQDAEQKQARADLIEAAMGWARQSGQVDIEVELLGFQANLFADPTVINPIYERALALARQSRLKEAEAHILRERCNNSFSANHYARIEYGEQALALYRQLGDRYNEGYTLTNIGVTYRKLGDFARALHCWEQSRDICRDVGNRMIETFAILGVVLANNLSGCPNKLTPLLVETLETVRELNIPWLEFHFLYHMTEIFLWEADLVQALAYAEQTRQFYAHSGVEKKNVSEATGCMNIGRTLLALDRLEEAAQAFRQSVATVEITQHADLFVGSLNWVSDVALTGLAAVALRQGKPRLALEYTQNIWHRLPRHEMSTPWTILVCYQAFQANADPRADQVLEESHRILLERADLISDDYMRRCYLENIPENREILALWQAVQEH